MSRLKAAAFYGAATVPLGILTHLSAEGAALGRFDLAFSPLHSYLGVLALASLSVVVIFVSGR